MVVGESKKQTIKLVNDLGSASIGNPIVNVLAHYGVPLSETRTLRFKAKDQDLALQYKDYLVFLTGVRPDENLPKTEKSFTNEQGETVIEIWQIVIYWGDDRPCLEARWNVDQGDFNVKPAGCWLANLNPQVVKHLADALKLLLWVQERITNSGRRSGLPKTLEAIRTDYIYLCACHIYLSSDDARPSDQNMADFYGVDRTTLYRHLKNNFGLSFSDVKVECEEQVNQIKVEDLPIRFRRYIDQKRSEQVTDTLIKK